MTFLNSKTSPKSPTKVCEKFPVQGTYKYCICNTADSDAKLNLKKGRCLILVVGFSTFPQTWKTTSCDVHFHQF